MCVCVYGAHNYLTNLANIVIKCFFFIEVIFTPSPVICYSLFLIINQDFPYGDIFFESTTSFLC